MISHKATWGQRGESEQLPSSAIHPKGSVWSRAQFARIRAEATAGLVEFTQTRVLAAS